MTPKGQDYNQLYIGETARPLDTRIKEHLSCCQSLSAVREHKLNTGHQSSIRDVQILELEENWHSIKNQRGHQHIKGKPSLNRDISQELPPVMLVSCDTTVKFSSLKKSYERQPKYTEKTRKFLEMSIIYQIYTLDLQMHPQRRILVFCDVFKYIYIC